MICCDICGTSTHCVQKRIDGKEFDLCDQCSKELAEKQSGKGRTTEPAATEQVEEYDEISIY